MELLVKLALLVLAGPELLVTPVQLERQDLVVILDHLVQLGLLVMPVLLVLAVLLVILVPLVQLGKLVLQVWVLLVKLVLLVLLVSYWVGAYSRHSLPETVL
jgi:hypothetical protein